MPAVVVQGGDVVSGADPATVWALVADPERVAEWAPVRFVGWMGREVPDVGQAFFVTLDKHADPSTALRLEIVEWVAGHSYRCAIGPPDERPGTDELIEVSVTTELRDHRPVARFDLTYTGSYPGWQAPIAWWRAKRLIDKAVRGVAAASH